MGLSAHFPEKETEAQRTCDLLSVTAQGGDATGFTVTSRETAQHLPSQWTPGAWSLPSKCLSISTRAHLATVRRPLPTSPIYSRRNVHQEWDWGSPNVGTGKQSFL